MIRITQLKMPVVHTARELARKAAGVLKIKEQDIQSLHIVKQSVDARKKDQIYFSYTVDITVAEEKIVRGLKNANVSLSTETPYHFPDSGTEILKTPPVIIGSGPAGLFCGLLLARAGYCPLILERGADVLTRTKQVEEFWNGGSLDVNSNVQFGEGGAGTFSDGKLNTLVKDPKKRNRLVLEILAEFGADASILYKNKPHIGTDVLSQVVRRIRQEIIRLGGQVRFHSTVTDFLVENPSHLSGVVVNGTERIKTQAVVLAVGHSARDTFEALHQKQVPMEQKAFAVGLRIQHPQRMINLSQYGTEELKELGAASYKLTHQTKGGRGVYSFCMCPGGYVVNAASEKNRLAVNGMSYHDQGGENANSALIVTVSQNDFPDASPLAGVAYQRHLEELAYRLGGGRIPVQLYGDFKEGRKSHSFGDVSPQFKGEFQFANLREALPSSLSDALLEGMQAFDRTIKGFGRPDAVLAGIESRTSSPLRICRGDDFESKTKGLFPCGEGAGYAGGITSAAMDGIKVAEELARRYAPLT